MNSSDNTTANPPSWLRWFVNDAIRGIMHGEDSAPVGCHFYLDRENDLWEVTLFVGRSEVLGGAWDGKVVPIGLEVDISRVIAAFDSQPDILWQAEKVTPADELGAHVSFAGVTRGNNVWLRILQDAPDWAGVGRLLHASTGQFEDLW
ncbi:MAG: hypothetical protein RLZZ232_1733 [Planctomycetota bacterium]|jgi:hypothetical protein